MVDKASKIGVHYNFPEPKTEPVVMSKDEESFRGVLLDVLLLVVLKGKDLHYSLRDLLLFRLSILGFLSLYRLADTVILLLELICILITDRAVRIDCNLVVFKHETI